MHLPRHLLSAHGIETVKAAATGARESAEPAGPDDGARQPPAPEDGSDGHEVGPAGEAPPRAPSDETAPRKPGLLDRLRSRRGRGRGGQHQAPVPGERAPRREKAKGPRGRRVPLDVDISDIWAFGGRRLEHTAHYATGRMLQFQAPAAGVIFDRAIAGTLPDRILFQPIARNRDKYEDAAFLIAGPLLTFSITTTITQMQAAAEDGDAELYHQLDAKLQFQREAFMWAIQMMLPRLAEGAKKAREKKAKADAQIADAFPELGDDDPAEVLASMLFAPPTFTPPTQEATNGKRESYDSADDSGREGAIPL